VTTAILKPYTQRRDPGPLQKAVMGIGLVALAAVYGLLLSVLPMQLLLLPLVPILLGVALILWLLPDIGGVHEVWMRTSMQWYVLLNVLWPTYVAINAPGLPWISGTRIVLFALMSAALINYATSSEFRGKIADGLATIPLIQKAFWTFWGATAFALLISVEPFVSLSKFANNQIYWTAMLALSAWLATSPGFAARIGRTLGWTIMIVGALAVNEYRASGVVWLPYLPGWLTADEGLLELVSGFNGRAGTTEYRVRGTFSGALYFAEYLAITLPFAVHMLFQTDRLWKFTLVALGVVATMMAMYFTNSRSAALAMLLTPLLYGFMASWRVRQQRPGSLAASSVLFAYPAVAALLAVLLVFWRRLHVMIIGGAQHQGSTDARATQWAMGWPKILSRPFGHGSGTSGNVLGFYNPGGDTPTVDSYVLTLLLDYGVIGLAAFVVLLAATIWYGFQAYNRAETDEMKMLAPITIALFNFFVIKLVSSTEGSMPIVFILIGCVIGLTAQQQRAGLVARRPGRVPPATATVMS
jgi:O-Antigen ligase